MSFSVKFPFSDSLPFPGAFIAPGTFTFGVALGFSGISFFLVLHRFMARSTPMVPKFLITVMLSSTRKGSSFSSSRLHFPST